MAKEKIEVGSIRPVYNIAGFEVCKTPSDKPEEAEWIPVEKLSDAEILSFVYKQKPGKGNKKTKEAKAEVDEEDL